MDLIEIGKIVSRVYNLDNQRDRIPFYILSVRTTLA
jgi:hypothetical protein